MSNKSKFTSVKDGIKMATSTINYQPMASKAEALLRKNTMRTQGRNGCRMDRINLPLTPDNNSFVRIMAKMTGQTLGGYINYIIQAYRDEHPDLYNDALALKAKAMPYSADVAAAIDVMPVDATLPAPVVQDVTKEATE